MKCKKCSHGNFLPEYGFEDGLCWPCRDEEVINKWHSPKDIRTELQSKAQKLYDKMTDEQKDNAKKLVELDESEKLAVKVLDPGPLEQSKDDHTLTDYITAFRYKYFPITVQDSKNPTESRTMTLPTDSSARKDIPLFRGCLKYFGAALAGVARISYLGNQKHNPGQDLHHARGKSTDHADCILRHLMDTADLLAAKERGADISDQQILDEVNQMAWRALAFSQELQEQFGAPLAPGAKKGN